MKMAYKILILEDDPMVADIINSFLKKIDSTMFAVVTISSSLDQAEKKILSSKFDLMLLDDYLPDGTGVEFLGKLRKKGIVISAIMITAANDISTVKQAIAYGVIDYLIKPFQFVRFEEAISKFWHLVNTTSYKKNISQQDINSYFQGNRSKSGSSIKLPKGISQITLKLIIQEAMTFKTKFSNKELSEKINLSRVTTKKYLDYLVAHKVLHTNLVYSEIGRPLTIYYINRSTLEDLK